MWCDETRSAMLFLIINVVGNWFSCNMFMQRPMNAIISLVPAMPFGDLFSFILNRVFYTKSSTYNKTNGKCNGKLETRSNSKIVLDAKSSIISSYVCRAIRKRVQHNSCQWLAHWLLNIIWFRYGMAWHKMQNATRFKCMKKKKTTNFYVKISIEIRYRQRTTTTAQRRRHDVDGKGAKPITALAVSAH